MEAPGTVGDRLREGRVGGHYFVGLFRFGFLAVGTWAFFRAFSVLRASSSAWVFRGSEDQPGGGMAALLPTWGRTLS